MYIMSDYCGLTATLVKQTMNPKCHTVSCWSQSYLIEKQFPALLLFQVHFLDSHLFASGIFSGNAHDASGALTNLDEVLQLVAWITW